MLPVWRKVRQPFVVFYSLNIKANNILATRESSHTKILEHCFGLLFSELREKCKREKIVPSGLMMGRYDLTKRRVQRLVPAGHGEKGTCCLHSSLWQILPGSHEREQEMSESK